MTEHPFEDEEEMPQWDVALEALVTEEHQKQGQALRTDDFLRLARAHAIRFDDIMDTVLRMVVIGEWSYRDSAGEVRVITQDEFDRLYESGRLRDEDLIAYTGSWRPAEH